MCDEYYDARMKAFWRALADEEEKLEADEEPIPDPIVIEPLGPHKPTPKPLAR